MVKPSELGATETEASAYVRRIELVAVEKTHRFALPQIIKFLESRGKSWRVEGAADDEQFAKHLKTRFQNP